MRFRYGGCEALSDRGVAAELGPALLCPQFRF